MFRIRKSADVPYPEVRGLSGYGTSGSHAFLNRPGTSAEFRARKIRGCSVHATTCTEHPRMFRGLQSVSGLKSLSPYRGKNRFSYGLGLSPVIVHNLILTLCIKILTSFRPDHYLVSARCAKIAHLFWPSHCFVTAPLYDNQSFVMVPPLFRYGPVYKKYNFVTARSLFRYGPRRTKTAPSLRPGEFGP